MTFKTWTYKETTLASAELNSNFAMMNKKLAYDNTSKSISGNDDPEAKISPTISIGAGVVTDHILITFDLTGMIRSTDTKSECHYVNFPIKIGETGSLVTKINYKPAGGGGYYDTFCSVRGNYTFYYEPTTDEKTNGFDIEVWCALVDAGSDGFSPTITGTYNSCLILGG